MFKNVVMANLKNIILNKKIHKNKNSFSGGLGGKEIWISLEFSSWKGFGFHN